MKYRSKGQRLYREAVSEAFLALSLEAQESVRWGRNAGVAYQILTDLKYDISSKDITGFRLKKFNEKVIGCEILFSNGNHYELEYSSRFKNISLTKWRGGKYDWANISLEDIKDQGISLSYLISLAEKARDKANAV
jgi:hypothetical protein